MVHEKNREGSLPRLEPGVSVGAHDGALVKKEGVDRKRKKEGWQSQANAGYGYVNSFSFTLFYTFMYASLLPSTSKHTTPTPEGSTMAAPVPHLTKAKEKHDERQNN